MRLSFLASFALVIYIESRFEKSCNIVNNTKGRRERGEMGTNHDALQYRFLGAAYCSRAISNIALKEESAISYALVTKPVSDTST